MSAAPPYELTIRTPEGVSFSLQLAGPVARFLAWLLDFFCIMVVMIGVNVAVRLVAVVSKDMGAALSTYLFFALSIGYPIALEWAWRGQTIGKRLLRLRVLDADGLHLRFSQIVVRNLLRLVDNLPLFYLVGGLACFFSPRAQRLGDLAAGTVVVRYPVLNEPALEKIKRDKFNSLGAYPVHTARLRQTTSPAEAALLVRALLLRDAFEPAARVDLFGELAGHFRGKAALPQEALDGVSDEQFLKNIVGVLFRIKEDSPRA